MNDLEQDLKCWLTEREQFTGLRQLQVARPMGATQVRWKGERLLNFSSNDYLGLAQHPELIDRAIAWTTGWGVGAGASRLVTGTLPMHRDVERKLARLKGAEAALIMNSGFQANATVMRALFDQELLEGPALVYADKHMHASMVDGCQGRNVRLKRYRHNDLGHLETLLKRSKSQSGKRFILTESVFSMDGDCADVEALSELAGRYDAFLYLDEAHATGVMGKDGTGLSGPVPDKVQLAMGTFSKALGGFGAYVVCSERMKAYLVNRCAGFIYSTALPPGVLGAMDAALDLIPELDAARERLAQNGETLRQGFQAAGLDTGTSNSQIVPVMLGDSTRAQEASEFLRREGVLGIAIRPPTVPPGGSRIRFAVTADHRVEDLQHLIDLAPGLAEYAD